MSQRSISHSEVKPAVPLLDVLLRIREDIRNHTVGPYLYIGMPDVSRIECFVVGYAECLRSFGVEKGADALFGEWFRDVKKAWPGQGWAKAYLEEFHGDQERALRKYLDFVAEFRALPPEGLAAIPWRYGGEHPATQVPSWTPIHPPKPTLDLLLEVRRVIGDVPGRLGLFIGYIDVRRMAGFIEGYRLCLALAGARDEEYARFERWLQEDKGLPPGQEWTLPLLQACQGDAEQAIRRLLEYAVEFRSRAPSAPGAV
ncbi:hypothetical protein [Vitiosangium sp. GDMCC 1.1324]|uniref:hypothetical protein n=1 Tax=Vitiosangium sp. (strain GDMCC 1.1324) TaxID=2138576 RepID=UPI000D37B3EE|nr:hypothetical protein [Vitiosangium sp. GDMCC 1.1324]PTL77111.1 hypothetical protein DAT35_46595 [Vitiosangium sp. GDMCC 1.1324]